MLCNILAFSYNNKKKKLLKKQAKEKKMKIIGG
jgi:hypothetical protein